MNNIHVLPPNYTAATQPATPKVANHLVLKIAAGVVLGITFCGAAVYSYQEYNRMRELPERSAKAFASLHDDIAAQNDQLVLDNDRIEASLHRHTATKHVAVAVNRSVYPECAEASNTKVCNASLMPDAPIVPACKSLATNDGGTQPKAYRLCAAKVVGQ
jgi:hypothetical protein